MFVVYLPPLDYTIPENKELALSSSSLWPQTSEQSLTHHSIVLLNWPTPKPILFGDHSSCVEEPLKEALLSITYKPPSHPLNHSKEKSPNRKSATSIESSIWVRVAYSHLQCPKQETPGPARRRTMFSHLHSSRDTNDVTNQTRMLKGKMGKKIKGPLGNQVGSPSLSVEEVIFSCP